MAPLANDPSGQTVPVEVTDCGGRQEVRSLALRVKPGEHAVQTPDEGVQDAQPMEHATTKTCKQRTKTSKREKIERTRI